jgi:hypothetical protein
MRIEGEVGLEMMVWMAQSPEARIARALANSVRGSDWTLAAIDRQRVRWRAGVIEVEARHGSNWSGLVSGRIHENEPSSADSKHSFRPYAIDVPSAPLRLESCWFAVDLEGRVACFDRDTLGAAPMKRCWGPRPEPHFAAYEPDSIATVIAGRHARAHLPSRHFTFVADPERLVRAFEKTPPEAAARRWTLSLAASGVVVSAGHAPNHDDETIPLSLVQWLHTRDLCEGCVRSPMRDPRLEGVFVYAHARRDRAAPYERVGEPSVAWSLEQAAEHLGLQSEALRRSTLPVLFTAKHRLQPVEYVQCTWSETVPWESESGERHGARRLA